MSLIINTQLAFFVSILALRPVDQGYNIQTMAKNTHEKKEKLQL